MFTSIIPHITLAVLIVLVISLILLVLRDRGFTGFRIPKWIEKVLGLSVLAYLIMSIILLYHSF